MAAVYSHLGQRCQNHPHRPGDRRCDRCARPHCDDCLTPSPRRADGTREWLCGSCAPGIAPTTAGRARPTNAGWTARLTSAIGAARGAALVLVAALLAGAAVMGAVALLTRSSPRPGTAEELLPGCGELTRIASVGAIGTRAAEDAVNVLAYPQRARARLAATGALRRGGQVVSVVATPDGTSGGADDQLRALVDECPTGWRIGGPVTLPLTLVFDTGREP